MIYQQTLYGKAKLWGLKAQPCNLLNFFVVLFLKITPKRIGNPKMKTTRPAVIAGPRRTIE